jgi:hypothetical protein
LVALTIVGAGSLSAQDSTLTRLRARADSVAREWRQANAIADLVDSLAMERAAVGKDTIAVAALRIVANPSPLPMREAAVLAWAAIDSLYGAAGQELVNRPYIIRAYDPDTNVRRPVLHVGMEVPWNMGLLPLTQLLVANVPIAPTDSGLAGWLGGVIRPSTAPDQDRARVYVRLVTAPSQAARSCFLGDLPSCRSALGLDQSAEPFLRWYPSPGERRLLITRSFAEYFNRGAHAATLRACTAGQESACTELLRALPIGSIPRPLGFDARATLVHAALHLGGREAYRRLLANPSLPIADRLGAAAGLAVDSLLVRWRAEVLASRPIPVALPPWAIWIALAWTGVFAACGLRSSRWRVA